MKTINTIILLLILWPSFHGVIAQLSPKITFDQEEEHYIIKVSGIEPYILDKVRKKSISEDSWRSIFQIYTGSKAPEISLGYQPMTGSYKLTRREVIFTPAFQLIPGLQYNANFNIPLLYSLVNEPIPDPGLMRIFKAIFMVPENRTVSETWIEAIYPSIDTIPMNQLKLYIYFSSPMKYGEAMNNIHLYNQYGKEEKDSFLNIPQELWNHDQTRLTVFFDPGRIKRDLVPNLQMGAPLRQNENYILRIDSTWKDKSGKHLKSGFEKKFYVIKPDRESPDSKSWELYYPGSDTREALLIDFNEPLEFALLQRLIVIKNSKGEYIEGEILIDDYERSWKFVPKNNWLPGDYEVQIDVNLEDLAGNNFRRLFDMDITKDSLRSGQYHSLKFSLKPN